MTVRAAHATPEDLKVPAKARCRAATVGLVKATLGFVAVTGLLALLAPASVRACTYVEQPEARLERAADRLIHSPAPRGRGRSRALASVKAELGQKVGR
jgi:hypothetical protein